MTGNNLSFGSKSNDLNKRNYILFFIMCCYALVLGHNLIPHVHHSHDHCHQHEEGKSLLDKLLENHEHSNDLGHEQVDAYTLSDNDISLNLWTTPAIIPVSLGDLWTCSTTYLVTPFAKHIYYTDTFAHDTEQQGPPPALRAPPAV